MRAFIDMIKSFVSKYFSMPQIGITDIIEILIIAVLLYNVMIWVKKTKAWALFKGILVLLVFTIFASFLHLSAILWLIDKTLSVGIIAIIVVFQPELRRALEQLGRKNILANIFALDTSKELGGRFSDKTINEIIEATFELAKANTGALIVMEQVSALTEFELTGIELDSIVTSQLLVNIFENNTPLHDGAIIVRGDRIVAATCYLPLSTDMKLSKELGTRHRAALGVSEETDALTIIVSEETGKVSIAYSGELTINIDRNKLRSKLELIQDKKIETKRRKIWKGRGQDEKQDSK